MDDELFEVEIEEVGGRARKSKRISEATREMAKETGIEVKEKSGIRYIKESPEVLEVVDALEAEERKSRNENLAWHALENKLKQSNPSDKLIEMVLGKHFPKTSLNVNVKLDNLDRDGLIQFLENA